MEKIRKQILVAAIGGFTAATILTVMKFEGEGSGTMIFMILVCIAGLTYKNK